MRAISIRAEITLTSFTNTYPWGDLKADPDPMWMKWFDLSFDVTNRGTRRFGIRLPRALADLEAWAPYRGSTLYTVTHGDKV